MKYVLELGPPVLWGENMKQSVALADACQIDVCLPVTGASRLLLRQRLLLRNRNVPIEKRFV